jgi:intein/homing endonuclease
MIRIKDEKGGDILITDGHPVFTVLRGVVLARNLKEGDIVKRIDGNAKITSITPEPYDGMVYNLRLGTLEEGGQDKTSLFANGILMGDNMMQRYYGRLDKQKPLNQKNFLERGLPKEWLKDFQYSESKKQE